ncbi:MAG: FG-GAP-like repeat-containing protein [Myxococcota bacterium]
MPRSLLFLLLAFAAVGCRDDLTRRRNEPLPIPNPTCGDGKIDEGEECDGSELGGASCQSLGFDTGSLSCDGSCKHVTVACVKRCGNGVLDLGEACDGTLGDFSCASWGYKTCSPQCTVAASHCVTTSFVVGPAHQETQGGPSTLADLSPKGFGDLIVAVPGFSRVETFPYNTQQGFVEGRKPNVGHLPIAPIAADLDGDGETDIATLNVDGTATRLKYTNNSFPAEDYPSPDGGALCSAFAWIGAGRMDADGSADLAALGCPSGVPVRAGAIVVWRGGSSPFPAEEHLRAGIVAADVGDADGDGLVDLLYVTEAAAELRVLLAPTFAEAAPIPLPFIPSRFAAADADGDGDLDLATLDGTMVKVLENTGAGFAERQSTTASNASALFFRDLDLDGRPDVAWLLADRVHLRRNVGSFLFMTYEAVTGAGTPLTLSAGDVDGDGDLDLAATYGQGGDATTTYVLLNKVR